MSIVWRSAGTVRAIPVLPSMEAPPSSPSLQQEIPTCLRRRVETSATCSGSWSPIPHTLYFLRAEALGLVVGQCTRFPDPLHKGKTKRIVLYQDFLGSLCPEKQRTSSPSGTGPSGVDTHRPRDALSRSGSPRKEKSVLSATTIPRRSRTPRPNPPGIRRAIPPPSPRDRSFRSFAAANSFRPSPLTCGDDMSPAGGSESRSSTS